MLKCHKGLAALSYLILILIFLFYSLSASQALQSFSYKWTTVAAHEQYSLQKTLNGELPKPYIYRVLIPYVVNFVVNNAPNEYLEALRERSYNTLRANIGNEISLMNDRIVTSYGVVVTFDFVLLVSSMFALRAIARHVYWVRNRSEVALMIDVAPILFTLMLSLSYRVHNGFVYDHLEIFCLTVYLWLAFQGRRLLSLPVLVVAVLNKETAVLFPLFGMAIAYASGGMKYNKSLLIRFAPEFLVVLCVYLVIRYVFRDAPGGSVEFHAAGNIYFWASLKPWISITTPHLQLVPLPKPTNLIFLIPIISAIFYGWACKPNVVKVPLVIALVVNIPLLLLFSYRDEFRNLSLTFPFIFLASTHSVIYFYSKDGANDVYGNEIK